MNMRGFYEKILLIVMVVVAVVRGEEGDGLVTWADKYYVTWGHQPLVLDQTSELQLTLDHTSGSGFESYSIYGSGSFNMKIKAPQTKSTGVVTSFYIKSKSSRPDELCFQILGSNDSPYLLNTNMFLYGEGNKDQRFRLWFDPTKDYHSYRLLWNPHQVVFYVDDTPIRVHRKTPDVSYPSMQTMFIMGSVKNLSKIDPKQTPYIAKFQASKLEGCETTFFDIGKCTGPTFWWNRKENWQLSSREMKLYTNARKVYLDYDYCSDRKQHPKVPQECSSNN